MKRRDFLKTSSLGIVGSLLAPSLIQQCAATADRPNILFIMSDDHTANAWGCYESHLSELADTPNIDRLAAEGVRLDRAYCTNSICVPSRASILTGQYSHRNGVYTLVDAIDPEQEHVGHWLQNAGYETALIGKWHLKTAPAGFHHWEVLPGQGDYHDPVLKTMDGGERQYEGFSADVITDLSLDWLQQRDSDQPFCLMTHFKSSHEPWHYADRHADLFTDVDIPEPPSLWEDKSHRSPGSRDYGFTMDDMAYRQAGIARGDWPTGNMDITGMDQRERKRWAYQKFLKDFLRCGKAIDENIGRLLAYLDEHGLAENTVVIYTSDQGYFLGEHDYIDKRWMFEESMQMPLVARYPGEIPAGSVNDDIILNVDFAPTLLEYAGATPPESVQGRSMRANLQGETPGDWRTAMYYRYWMHGNGASRPAHYGIRTEEYKLIFYYGLPLDATGTSDTPTHPGWELYDLKRDPQEMDNVYEDPKYADIIANLKEQLLALKAELGDTDEQYPELMALRDRVW